MHIVIAGGSGFLGTALTHALTRDSHDVTILTRRTAAALPAQPRVKYVSWDPERQQRPLGRVAQRRRRRRQSRRRIHCRQALVLPRRRRKLRESRLGATQSLTAAIREAARAPSVLRQRIRRRLLRRSRRRNHHRSRHRRETIFSPASPRNGRRPQPTSPHITRVALIRTGIVLDRQRRRAGENAAAVSDVRRRPARIGTSIHAVDPQRGLGTAGDMGDDARRARGAAERDEPGTGHECGIFESARTRIAPAEPAARTAFCAAPGARRNGRRAAAERPARAARPRY